MVARKNVSHPVVGSNVTFPDTVAAVVVRSDTPKGTIDEMDH